jgi:hypothetical protein
VRNARAEHGRDRDLHHGAGNRDTAHRHQIGNREVDPDPNMSRITPISASCCASAASATNPG